MKVFLLTTSFLIISIVVFSQTPCPTQFLRTNGNNIGCGSHIKLYFAACPSAVPTLDSIGIDGVVQPQTFTFLAKVCNGGNTYIDYCISNNNLPPANHITVYLTYPNGASGGTGGSIVCNIPEPGPTPVVLSTINFQRNNNNNDVFAVWQTQQEINSGSFEIERAFNINSSFQKIGTVLAAGTSNYLRKYIFIDNSNSNKGISFYRIKMIDKDGQFAYSEIKSVKGSGMESDFIIFPNPARGGNARITISEISEPTQIQIHDVSGRLIKAIVLKDVNTTTINDIRAGTYFVRFIGQMTGNVSVRKLSVID